MTSQPNAKIMYMIKPCMSSHDIEGAGDETLQNMEMGLHGTNHLVIISCTIDGICVALDDRNGHVSLTQSLRYRL
eukprot:scaffold74990_cov17-Prasinocladus_malaysianus.AAC.2